MEPNNLTEGAIADFNEYIASQVLASEVKAAPVENPAEDEILDIDGTEVKVKIEKAS